VSDVAAVVVRRAVAEDRAAVLDLLALSLGWDRGPEFGDFFDWKHERNSFGPSPGWVAVVEGRVVGFRTFLRWEFEHPDGRLRRAVRAVDTATAPDQQGRGIFRRLTLAAIDDLRREDVDFVFNTPNTKSRPGYLKMGWTQVGRLPAAVRVMGPGGARRLLGSRVPAERWSLPVAAGVPATELLADARIETLLGRLPRARGLRTARTVAYLRWRYGHPPLGYRAIVADGDPASGLVVFRVRRRGKATEAAVSDVFVPEGAESTKVKLLREVARSTAADYAIIVGTSSLRARYVPIPRQGPILTWRPLADPSPPPQLRGLDLSLGDVELF
jgi:GNAT superfamily N-acetyltransferase